ncbi:NAD(P)/FAD-dependent oxidoreductase [Naumannella halotolerans]|uniref:Flavin-dependent dehydrogenase n=1 Tax=Naumannella halotolerans TaxID=993414 RepID=A0A4R7IZE4_9ACTN|nr:NAD(P)/FAD-dependent oxidoreductase [Naumannella halotolerans]TDT30100.1 flavin-dependent dehydrogenase [Naumannella halotolerans]
MYDAIIVGARVAGSSTAMLLARRGYKVLCVDRASFPSDTVSTHMISVGGAAQLRRWGLLDQVAETGCPAVTNINLDLDFPRYGKFVLSGFPEPVDDGFAAIYAPKRTVLDHLLVEAASAAGAEIREEFTVDEVLIDDAGTVTGIRGHDSSGTAVVEKARIVIGADGFRSLVADAVDAPKYHYAGPKAFGYYTYWDGVPIDSLEFYTRPDMTIIAFPTHDEQAAVFVERPERQFSSFKKDVERSYRQTVAQAAPGLSERIDEGTLAHPFKGVGKRPNFFRKPGGPGWALVGDAGAHKDPITAQGITDAFRDAELLANAIDGSLSGGAAMQTELDLYEQRRNIALKPLYDFIIDHATMEPFDDVFQDVLASLRTNPAGLSHFFGVIQNTVAWSDFFSPAYLTSLFEHDTQRLAS